MAFKYKEKQQFNDRFLFLSIYAGFVSLGAGFLYYLINDSLTANRIIGLLSASIVLLGVWWWLKHLQLKVSVNEKQIKFKLKPYQQKSKIIRWEEVTSCKIVEEPQASLWHGGNLHFCREEWYSLQGRNGLYLTTKHGDCYLIGFKHLQKLKSYLKNVSIIAS